MVSVLKRIRYRQIRSGFAPLEFGISVKIALSMDVGLLILWPLHTSGFNLLLKKCICNLLTEGQEFLHSVRFPEHLDWRHGKSKSFVLCYFSLDRIDEWHSFTEWRHIHLVLNFSRNLPDLTTEIILNTRSASLLSASKEEGRYRSQLRIGNNVENLSPYQIHWMTLFLSQF